MDTDRKFWKSVVEVSHIEFQSYSFFHRKLVYTSGLAGKILGYTAKQLREYSEDFYEDLVHPDDREQLHQKTRELQASASGQVIEMTVRLRRSDGVFIWIYTRKLVTKRDKDGNPCTIVTVAEDISNLIGLQNELKERVDQLDMISWKNSHLIKGPVASIIGLVNLIEEEEITSSHNRQVFDYIRQVMGKLNSVIQEIIYEADKQHYRTDNGQ